MKQCLVCLAVSPVAALSCGSCGEASWASAAPAAVSQPAAAEAPKKTSRKKKSTEPVAEPVEASVEEPAAISDEEFAAALPSASDNDLLSLLGDQNLKPAWRQLVDDEIDRRMS